MIATTNNLPDHLLISRDDTVALLIQGCGAKATAELVETLVTYAYRTGQVDQCKRVLAGYVPEVRS